MQTPEFMPVLSGGCHNEAKDGACVMEYVSFITGDVFSDMPTCTPRSLARIAQYANDYQYDDEMRSDRLLPLMSRLIGEGQDPNFDRHIAEWLYHKGLESTRTAYLLDMDRIPAPRGGKHHRYCRDVGAVTVLMSYVLGTESWVMDYPKALVDLLVECLDEYDRYLGRETPTMSEEQTASVHRLAALIGG